MALTATMVSGCSNRQQTTSAPTRPFIIWSFEPKDAWTPIGKEIQKKIGDREVKYYKKTMGPNYEKDALNSILSGQGPDIWAIPSQWAYRHKDKLVPVPEKIAPSIDIDQKYVQSMKQACMIEGKIYCLSPYSDTLMVYYNPTIFEKVKKDYLDSHPVIRNGRTNEDITNQKNEISRVEAILTKPPYTWDSFSETSRLLTVKNGTSISQSGVAMGTSQNVASSVDLLYALMMQNGTSLASNDLKLAAFNLPGEDSTGKQRQPGKNALDFMVSFSNPTSPNYSWNLSMPRDVDAFIEGKVAMIFAYTSLSGYLAQNYPNFKYKTSALPQIGDSQANIVDYASFYTFAVPKLSPYSTIAWQTISEISSSGSLNSSTNQPSSAKKKNFVATLNSRPNDNPLTAQPQTAKTWLKGRYPDEVDNIFKAVIDKTNTEPNNSQAFLDNAAIEVTNLYKRTEW